MKLFDGHCHLTDNQPAYPLKADRRNIIFNSLAQYTARHGEVPVNDVVTLLFDFTSDRNLAVVRDLHDNGRIRALKIHSRIQRIRESEFGGLLSALKSFNTRLPIIYDAFYYGHDVAFKPSLANLVELAAAVAPLPVIVAHSGGYNILKYFFHLRQVPNIWYDLSLSLQLLSDSSAITDLKKLVRWTDKSRLLFGSDFPDGDPQFQLDVLNGICRELDIGAEDREKIFYGNAARLFGAAG